MQGNEFLSPNTKDDDSVSILSGTIENWMVSSVRAVPVATVESVRAVPVAA